ncbi:MAG: hypothetical protein OEZ59_04405 [Deltaproteobacteria bacterium]|nr:hypothetical protein [Deltaproteobacteria bacterium]
MILCSVNHKAGRQIGHFHIHVQLGSAAAELFRIYERCGGPEHGVEALIETSLENCLSESGAMRGTQQAHLHHMLRVKDLHLYILSEPELTPLKLKLLELLTGHGEARSRWAASRELLLTHMDELCKVAVPGLMGNIENYKSSLSRRDTPVGRLLVLIALFNFDQDEELPPHNLMIRFQRGSFPEHRWESSTEQGSSRNLASASWSPSAPLCRWEYLALDLTQALMARFSTGDRTTNRPEGFGGKKPSRGWNKGFWSAGRHGPDPDERLYCRVSPPENSDSSGQLDLLPFDAEEFITELRGLIHKDHGPEGARQFAVLMEALLQATPGEPLELDLEALARRCDNSGSTPRERRTRMRKLARVLDTLSRVEISRMGPGGPAGLDEIGVSRMLTILERRTPRHTGAAGPDGSDPTPRGACVLPDGVFWDERLFGLRDLYRALPEELLALPVSEYPFAVPLFIFLREAWTRTDRGVAPGQSLQGLADERQATTGQTETDAPEYTARAIFQRAGLRISGAGRYKALQALKNNLEALRIHGLLGGWRIRQATVRDGMEDTYRVEAPGGGGRAASRREPNIPAHRAV